MYETLDMLIADVATWPEDDRVELLEVAREIESRRMAVYKPSPDEITAIEEGRADIDRGDFIEGAELEAFWEELTSESEAFDPRRSGSSPDLIAYRAR